MSRQTVEEYLETIKTLDEMEGSPVRTSSLARVLTVSSASVSEMLQRLSEKGLVQYTPYGGVSLTKKGMQKVLKLTRRHRLWEVFLNKHLNIGWEEVYNEACILEHNTSDLVTDKLANFLGNPTLCPHGSPIPDRKLSLPKTSGIKIASLESRTNVEITSITNEINSKLLQYLNKIGMVPGTRIEIVEKASYDGTITVNAGGSIKAISAEVASFIVVKKLV
ncbi:MAG: metal-dependent transcriptional regulator [Dehalococcoidia bacterium]|nr:MAG: metal-dependent transcriptional regulator [Dehalococcoidia bacterium]